MKLACAVDEITTLAPSEVAILDRDKKGEFLILEGLVNNHWRRSSYG